jgi:hypothetical protein
VLLPDAVLGAGEAALSVRSRCRLGTGRRRARPASARPRRGRRWARSWRRCSLTGRGSHTRAPEPRGELNPLSTERASGHVSSLGSFTTTTVAPRKRPHVGGQILRLPIGGRDASPARPEGLRRPPRRKMPGLASHRTRAASRPQPAIGGSARTERTGRPQSGCSPLIPRCSARAGPSCLGRGTKPFPATKPCVGPRWTTSDHIGPLGPICQVCLPGSPSERPRPRREGTSARQLRASDHPSLAVQSGRELISCVEAFREECPLIASFSLV